MHAEYRKRNSRHDRADKEAHVAADGEDAHAVAFARTGRQVGDAAAFRMEHGHAEPAYQSACHDKRIRAGPADTCHARTGQQHPEPHEPRACATVAYPAEQRLHHGRDHIGCEHQHNGLRIRVPVHHQEGQYRGKRTLVDVRARMPEHRQII